jgi:UDP-N-acetyl-D-mannosaminuronate dehydrogenase
MNVTLHDPLVSYWQEKDMTINTDLMGLSEEVFDIAVFAVRHSVYLDLSSDDILAILPGVKIIVDANNIISDEKARQLAANGVKMIGIGKGQWEQYE